MGCATSKVDDSPAVLLCRDRLGYLNQALLLRYSLSDCHLSYLHSLHSLSLSLHRFFDSSASLPPPPDAPGPPHAPPARVSSSGHLSHSNSTSEGSHLHFHDSDDESLHHHGHDLDDGHLHIDSGSESGSEFGSVHRDLPIKPGVMYEPPPVEEAAAGPGKPYPYPYPSPYVYQYPYPYPNNGGNVHMNYMRRHVTPSVSYEQKPASAESIHYGDPSSSSSSSAYYFNNYNHSNNQPPYNNDQHMNNGNHYNYPTGGYDMNYGVGGGGAASTSKPAPVPPPPPPPATSAWDFLNPFESIEANYPPYTPSSRDSREVREEEGIPDLEDEDFEHEVVKEVHGHQKLVDDHHHKLKNQNVASSSGGGSGGGGGERKSDVKRVEVEEVVRRVSESRPSAALATEENPVEYEVHMVDKKVVGDEAKAEQQGKGGFKSVFEAVKEIQVQFERAAASGGEVAKVLEVGKLRYQRKTGGFQVSTKMLNAITPSLPSSSKDSEGAAVDVHEEMQLRTLNLSATLQKLHLWEKKLFEEVKSEEKMRVVHDRKAKKLKDLRERGAEEHKVESTTTFVRSMSTKIRIAIQIVDRISATINKVRDEELWPQLNELILGLSRMWKAMLECHHIQYLAIDGARGLDAIAFPNNPNDLHLEATLQLEHDLINWTCRFTEWVGAQRGFVRALNSWLLKCIFYEPEVTADGIAPFSPGRAGAPPIFVICNQWSQSLERISETSEKEVIDAMRIFGTMVWNFRERDKGEMKQRMTANRDIEKKVKNLDREDVKMQKEIQALDKKMVLASGTSDGLSLSGNVVYQSDTSSKTSLQAGLRRIFETLDRFTSDSMKAYEELLQRTEEVIHKHGEQL